MSDDCSVSMPTSGGVGWFMGRRTSWNQQKNWFLLEILISELVFENLRPEKWVRASRNIQLPGYKIINSDFDGHNKSQRSVGTAPAGWESNPNWLMLPIIVVLLIAASPPNKHTKVRSQRNVLSCGHLPKNLRFIEFQQGWFCGGG